MSSHILNMFDQVRKPLFIITAGFIVLFCLLAVVNVDALQNIVNGGFAWSVKYFGLYWQILLLLTFIIGLVIAFMPTGKVVLGNVDKPEFSYMKWISMIMCTLLAGGGVFWAAGEPMAHFLSPPPLFDVPAKTALAVHPALAQSFMHWGFLAWAILGALTSVVLMYYHYHSEHKLPLAPRTLLYPVFGKVVMSGPLAWIVDAVCVIAVVAGTVGPIGFLGLQVGYGLEDIFQVANGLASQTGVILFLVLVYTISAVTGITKGIQILSRLNIVLAFLLLAYILFAGPTTFILSSYAQSVGVLVTQFFPMSLFRADGGWLGWWTVFFWGWFLGYGPLMAIFIARISRGRSIRQIVLSLSVLAPLVTAFWFTIVGGSGIFYELQTPGVISYAFEGFNLPAALLAITQQLPNGMIISVLFLVLTIMFVATTGDSMTYVISVIMSKDGNPKSAVRVFWGVSMGIVAIILIGMGGIGALQSFIVVTAVPVSLVLLPSLWNAPMLARKLSKANG